MNSSEGGFTSRSFQCECQICYVQSISYAPPSELTLELPKHKLMHNSFSVKIESLSLSPQNFDEMMFEII